MQKICMLWLMVGMTLHVHAQTLTIVDQESKKPIELATLISNKPYAFATTNAHGQVSISPFIGAEKIEIRSLGYETKVSSYQLLVQNQTLFMTPSSLKMDEVVVSATRWNQNANDIPVAIASVSSKDVSLQNPQTAADLLSISGKVFIQKSQQGGGSPMIRGFATNRLLYAVDGVRMNTAIFRGGNIQNVISLDPFAIEQTEVLFGPGSVIYGSDAIGGVMSFQTLTPSLALSDKPLISGKALTRYASANDEKTVHFDVNIGWEKWAVVSSISSNDFGDLRMGSHGPTDYLKPVYVQRLDSTDAVIHSDDPKVQRPSAYSQINLMQKVRFKPNTDWDIQYGFHYSETSSYGRYDRHLRYRDGLPRYGEWSYGPQKWMMNNLRVTHTSSAALYDQIDLRLAHQAFEESRMDRALNKADRSVRIEKVDAISLNLDLVKSTSEKNNLYYGAEWVQNDVHSMGIDENIETGIRTPGATRYPQATWASYALYINDHYRISNNLVAQAGLRYNQFKLDATFDTAFYPLPFTEAGINTGSLTGSTGLVYRPTEDWVISTNLATAFRSPNVDDVGKVFDSEPRAVTVPNPSLKAEYAYNVDLGVAKVLSNVLSIDISAYYTFLKDALVRRDYQLNGEDSIQYDGVLSQVQAMQNAAKAKVYGVQAGLDLKLGSGFGFASDINFQKGKEELNDGSKSPSRHAAPWFGVSRLTYVREGLNLQFYAEYSGERRFDQLPEEEKGKTEIYALDKNGNPYSPGWYTLNFKAMYQLTSELSISAGMENLTDRRYKPYSSGIAAPGRNFILSLRAAF
jgi:hemoglobin/transferrin/lactoferrin receptor protein